MAEIDILIKSIADNSGFKSSLDQLTNMVSITKRVQAQMDRFSKAGIQFDKHGNMLTQGKIVGTLEDNFKRATAQVIAFEAAQEKAATAKKNAEIRKQANSIENYTQKLMGAIGATNKLTDDTQRLASAGLGLRKQKDGMKVYDLQTKQQVGLKEVAMRVRQADMATKHYNETLDKFKKTMKEMPGSLARLKDGYNTARTAGQNYFTSAGYGLKHFSAGFNMAYLSLMFFSMAIMNVFKRLSTSTVSTFVEMADKTDMARMGIEKLKVGFTVLKFAIGEALANYLLPMIPAILDFVDKVLLWIDKNGDLIGSIVKWGLILGAGGYILSQFILGLAGIANAAGTFLMWLGKIGAGAEAATTSVSKMKTALQGLKTLGLLAGIGVGVKFIVDAWKILTNDGTTVGEYRSLVTEGAIAGALIGQFFGGLGGAAIGAAIGAAAGAIIVGIDVHFEIEKMTMESRLSQGEIQAAMGRALHLTEQDSMFIKYFGDWALELTPTYKENYGAQIKYFQDMRKSMEDAAVRSNLLEGYGGKDSAIQRGEEIASQITSLTESLYSAGTTGENLEITTQIQDLNEELMRISAATGVSTDQFNTVAAAQRMAAQETQNITSAYESFDDVLKNNIVSAEEFIRTVQPEKIQKLGDELEEFVSRMDDLDFTSVTKLGAAFTSLGQILGGTENQTGLVAALQDTVDKIDGEENSVVSSMNVLIGKIDEVGNTIETVLVSQVDSATNALNRNASAANDAAKAQERYNAAVDGAS